MQVSHVADHVTHAVMGSPESIEMAVTDSADFMIMMSSTLYTNQKLAVVREVLCNAWDAHIDAGVTDTPIQITLNQDTLTIQDAGKGIPHYLIGAVYGTFGGSTKQNDGMQTGGFGLGCKSPWAYVDHFQVTSCAEGIKTIYTMSKSSAQVGGKPAINKIVSMPTEETGMTVSFKIQPNDRRTFQNYLYQVVRNGEMKAELNGDPLPVLPFSQAKHDFLVLTESPTSSPGRLFVRYGNVIYPIPEHNDLETKGIHQFLETLPGSPVLVLQAPPHSISVTPSREALSMKEQTLKTLTMLVGNFQKLLNRHLRVEVIKVFDEGLQQAVQNKVPHKVLTPKREIPYLVPYATSSNIAKQLANPAELAKYQISHRYPSLDGFRRMEIRKRVQAAAAMGHISKPLAHTFLVEYRRAKHHTYGGHWAGKGTPLSTWFQRRIVAPLVQQLAAANLPTANLLAVGHGHDEGSYQRRAQKDSIVPAMSASRLKMTGYLLYLRQIVVLSHVIDPIDLLDGTKWPRDQQKYGFLNYRVSVTPKRIEETRAFFAAQPGLTVIDLLEDPADLREKLANRAKAKEKKVGILRADAALDSQLNWWTPANTRLELGKARIESPEWVCKATARKRDGTWEQMVESWDAEVTTTFLRLFGKVGGFYTNVNQTKKMQAVSPEVYLIRKVTEYIMGSDNLKSYFYVDPQRDDGFTFDYVNRHDLEQLYRRIMYTPKLREHFGMGYTLTELDRQMLTLWRWVAKRSEYSILALVPQAKPVLNYVANLPFHPKRFVLKSLLKDKGDVLELLDLDKIRGRLSSDNPDVVAHVMKVLLTTLEG